MVTKETHYPDNRTFEYQNVLTVECLYSRYSDTGDSTVLLMTVLDYIRIYTYVRYRYDQLLLQLTLTISLYFGYLIDTKCDTGIDSSSC